MASPPAIDNGSENANHQNGGTSGTVDITTAGANEDVFLFLSICAATAVTTAISATGIVWDATPRARVINSTNPYGISEEWHGHAASQLTSATITVTTSATLQRMVMGVVAFSGCSSLVWDSNGSIPTSVQTSVGATSASVNINTSQAHDVVFGFLSTNMTTSVPTAGSGFTNYPDVGTDFGGGSEWAFVWFEAQSFTTPQNTLAVNVTGITNAAGNSFTLIADAITADSLSNPSQGMFALLPSF